MENKSRKGGSGMGVAEYGGGMWRLLAGVTLLGIVGVGLFYVFRPPAPPPSYAGPRTFWPYQCVDTMKASRDEARAWQARSAAENGQAAGKQMQLIADSGANCVAIGTPYDAEFLPVLRAWVDGARSHNLHVWFRGNFSAWEGWFGYTANLSSEQLLSQGNQFIRGNAALFQDGDIFTLAPEAENGAAFDGLGGSGYGAYRDFLIQEHRMQEQAFAAIQKRVTTNWLSMSGGVAQAALDKTTVQQLGGIATIDHYVASTDEMGATIDDLHQAAGARVVLGEWGAPIPDINGSMSPEEQAGFVRQLLDQMAVRSSRVAGVNYWTLADSSTQLIADDMAPLPAYAVVARYYKPAVIKGTVKDAGGKRQRSQTIVVNGVYRAITDKHGNYALLVPSGAATIQGGGQTVQVQLSPGQEHTQDLTVGSLASL